jgi:preprotein translocase subunit SecD
MKPTVKRREAGELRIPAIIMIAEQTELLSAAVRGNTQADIDAAIEHAVDQFVNRNELAAQAVAHGVQHARDRIMHRNAMTLCAVVLLFVTGE